MLVTAVFAVFAVNNRFPLLKTSPDGTWTSEQGWPFVHSIQRGWNANDNIAIQDWMLYLGRDYSPTERNWARYANVMVGGLVCAITAYSVTRLSRMLGVSPSPKVSHDRT